MISAHGTDLETVTQMTTRPASPLVSRASLKPSDLAELRRLSRSRVVAARVAFRSRIVLLAAEGLAISGIASQLRTTIKTVRRWRDRYVQGGVSALTYDAPGRGRKPSISSETIARVVAAQGRPRHGRPPSCRQLANEFGLSAATISRILARAKQPGQTRDSAIP